MKRTGGCHCGAIRYEVHAEISKAISCNCSMCSKTGALLAFVAGSEFTQVSGKDAMLTYQFNKHVIHHNFCKRCGIYPFASGKEGVMVNVRCIDGVDLSALTIQPFDGKSL